MAIQEIRGNFLEILFSKDKKIQDFLLSLKQGDILKGRIIEIFPGQQKAIINFKGFNIISQIPENFTLSKGDSINVIVTQIGEKVTMKILNNFQLFNNQINNKIDISVLPQTTEYINILKSLNLPINEQYIYIAQKLKDYGLPINKENINEIFQKLNNYFENKGIEIYNIINVKDTNILKEIIFTNLIKITNEINNIIKEINLNKLNNTLTFEQKENLNQNLQKILNFLNINKELYNKISEIQIKTDNNSVIFILNNFDMQKNNNLLNILNNQNELKVSFNQEKNTIFIKIDNVILNLKNLVSDLIKFLPENDKIITNLKQIIDILTYSNNQDNFNYNLINIISKDNLKILQELKYNFSILKNIFINNENTNKNLNEIILLSNKINQIIEKFNENIDKFTSDNNKIANFDNLKLNINAINNLKNELLEINMIYKNDISKYDYILKDNKINHNEIITLYNTLKNFIDKIGNLKLLKEINNLNFLNNETLDSFLNKIDVESIIESIVFLKSRNIEINNKFIELMQKYFSNGMKLNQNIEHLFINLDKFEKIFKSVNDNEIKNLANNISNIKSFINNFCIKTDDNLLKTDIMQNQIKNFIEKSGLNVEAKILNFLKENESINFLNIDKSDQIIKSENRNTSENVITQIDLRQIKENFKSLLLQLNESIKKIDINNYSQSQKEILNQLNKNIEDILTNLNALQFINQKSISYDLIYTQIPIFLNNKFFNGEIQIWFKKGKLNKDISSEPFNIIFLLNTSNLGNIKISMFIYKNDIECIIRTENKKAKQILDKNKNDFLNNIKEMNYEIKNFKIIIEDEIEGKSMDIKNGYINIGKIDFIA